MCKKCYICGSEEIFEKFYGKSYCRVCYIKDQYGCDSVKTYLDKRNIKYHHSTINGNIILNTKDNNLIRKLISLSELTEKEWWMDVNFEGCVHFVV